MKENVGVGEIRALELLPEGLKLLDQRLLPSQERYMICRSAAEVGECIRNLAVRGAPAIGIAAAYGLYLAAREGPAAGKDVIPHLELQGEILKRTRPTAVNLAWAVERVIGRAREAEAGEASPAEIVEAVRAEAVALHDEDVAMNRRIGRLGAELVTDGDSVLTHCNAGALATGGFGTALGVVREAAARGKRVHVFVDETRPVLQGARLTAWEMLREGIPATLIADNMAAHFMRLGRINLVLVGADRICANGDVANKIGTYGLAVLAREHGIPFYIAAPWSTVDLSLPSGDAVVIEERDPAEVTGFAGVRWAPEGIPVANPAFDVTLARYVTAIITDRGVIRPPFDRGLAALSSPASSEPPGRDSRSKPTT